MTDTALRTAARPRFTGIQLLTGNTDAWHAKREVIAGATVSLDLCYFILENDATTAVLLQDLVAAAARGVKVRVLLDYFMTFKQSEVLRALAAVPNVLVRRFRPPTAQWCAALRELGIDDLRFIEGFTSMDLKLMASSFGDNKLESPSFASVLANMKPEPGESRLSLAVRMRTALLQEVANELLGLHAERQQLSGGGFFDRVLNASKRLVALPKKIAALHDVRDGLDLFLHRTHHKLLLADGREFIMGGRNIADAYHLDAVPAPGRPFIDTDVRVRDTQGSAEHAAAFNALWDEALSVDVTKPDRLDRRPATTLQAISALAAGVAHGSPGEHQYGFTPLPDADGYIVNNRPGPQDEVHITRAYVERIRAQAAKGRGRIDFVSAYVCFVEATQGSASLVELRQSLLDAAEAGVTVNLYTNSITTTDLTSINAVAYVGLGRMIRGGVNVFELADGQGSLHTKAAAIGDDWLLVGSYNFDPRSELYDTNNLIAFNDASGKATAEFRAARVEGLAWTRLDLETAERLASKHAADAVKLMLVARVL